jgi:formate dehydrogenase major subunit
VRKASRDGERVRLRSARSEIFIRVKISDMVAPGVASSTFHFPENFVNLITGDVVDSETKCPEYKVVAVDFEKV